MQSQPTKNLMKPQPNNRQKKMLAWVRHVLLTLGYVQINHQRLSIERGDLSVTDLPVTDLSSTKVFDDNGSKTYQVCYQGLTQAGFKGDDITDRVVKNANLPVMVKWQLSPIKTAVAKQKQTTLICPNLNDLQQEIQCLQRLKDSGSVVAVLNTHQRFIVNGQIVCHLKANKPEQIWQLDMIVRPFYPHKSAKTYVQQHAPLTNKQKWQLINALAITVAKFHQAGWIHGDIKPSNFLIQKKEDKITTYLIDLACVTQANTSKKLIAKNSLSTKQQVSGTPAYLAPECWQGTAPSFASDIYAFGVMMFEVIMEQKPFLLTQMNESISNHTSIPKNEVSINNPILLYEKWAKAHCQKPIPKLPKTYQQWQYMLDKLLAKRFEQRYQNMQEVIKELNHLKGMN